MVEFGVKPTETLRCLFNLYSQNANPAALLLGSFSKAVLVEGHFLEVSTSERNDTFEPCSPNLKHRRMTLYGLCAPSSRSTPTQTWKHVTDICNMIQGLGAG